MASSTLPPLVALQDPRAKSLMPFRATRTGNSVFRRTHVIYYSDLDSTYPFLPSNSDERTIDLVQGDNQSRTAGAYYNPMDQLVIAAHSVDEPDPVRSNGLTIRRLLVQASLCMVCCPQKE